MYQYRNILTGEVRRFFGLQQYPWHLVDVEEWSPPASASVVFDDQDVVWGGGDSLDFDAGAGRRGGGGSDSSW